MVIWSLIALSIKASGLLTVQYQKYYCMDHLSMYIWVCMSSLRCGILKPFLQTTMFPLREVCIAMSVMRRAGYSYFIVAHDCSDAPPLHTHLEESSLDMVLGMVSRVYQGVEEDNYTLLEEVEEDKEEEFRWAMDVLPNLYL